MRIDTQVVMEKYKDNLFSRGLFTEVLKLPEKYRIVIHLYYYEDYPVKEIAQILHTSESNIKVRLSRGRKMLFSSSIFSPRGIQYLIISFAFMVSC